MRDTGRGLALLLCGAMLLMTGCTVQVEWPNDNGDLFFDPPNDNAAFLDGPSNDNDELFADPTQPPASPEAAQTVSTSPAAAVQPAETAASSVPQEAPDDPDYQKLVEACQAFRTTVTLSATPDHERMAGLISRLRQEHPEIFWITSYQWAGPIVTVKVDASVFPDIAAMSAELDRAAGDVLAQMPEGLGDFEKALFVHDYLVEHTVYDLEGAASDSIGTFSGAYGCLVEHKAVCGGYSAAYALLMQRLGYVCGVCTGYGNGGAHGWNYICLGGRYYWTDVTWDDPVSVSDPGRQSLDHYYFLITDEMLLRDHQLGTDNYFVPVCDSMELNYYVQRGHYLERYSSEALPGYAAADGGHIEMLFCTKEAYDEAYTALFDRHDYWAVDAFTRSDRLSFSVSDRMYVIEIRY